MSIWGVSCSFQGLKFWNLNTREFIESAHAKWLNETGSEHKAPGSDELIPDAPSDINKLLNDVSCEVFKLVETL